MSKKLDVSCGTTTMYWRGCRCEPCRIANATYMRDNRWAKYGKPVQRTTQQRFWSFVEKTETCWLWRGALDGSGYGMFRLEHSCRSHRWIYEQLVGPIPEGLELDHLCRVRNCVNPAHLEAVTRQENNRRRRVTHCHRGHEFTDENTHWMRACKACWTVRRALKAVS